MPSSMSKCTKIVLGLEYAPDVTRGVYNSRPSAALDDLQWNGCVLALYFIYLSNLFVFIRTRST